MNAAAGGGGGGDPLRSSRLDRRRQSAFAVLTRKRSISSRGVCLVKMLNDFDSAQKDGNCSSRSIDIPRECGGALFVDVMFLEKKLMAMSSVGCVCRNRGC